LSGEAMARLFEGVCWFVAGVILWMATVSTITVAETVVAVLASAGSAVLAVMARQAMSLRVLVTGRWFVWLALVPVGAVMDTGRLVGWLVRRAPEPSEEDAVVHRRVPAGTAGAAVGWRAAATAAISATPGSVVIDADGDAGRLTLHRLVSGPPSIDERVEQ
jgi:multisubunit Na+/H+ antiporter MnhE subunit